MGWVVREKENHYPKDPAVLKIPSDSEFTTQSRSTICYRDSLARTSFSLVLPASLLPKKGSQRSNVGGRSKNTTAW